MFYITQENLLPTLELYTYSKYQSGVRIKDIFRKLLEDNAPSKQEKTQDIKSRIQHRREETGFPRQSKVKMALRFIPVQKK